MPGKSAPRRRVNRKRTGKPAYNGYEDGSAARKIDHVDANQTQDKKNDGSPAQDNRYARALSRGYVVFLTACCIFTTLLCVQYLQERSHLISLNDEIGILESRYNTIKGNNDARYNQIISSFTLEDVKDAAENRLGMHYAGADQVRYYSLSQDSYVRQYKEVTRTEQGAP